MNDKANHTLTVTFADVCGVNRTVTTNFSVPYGWKTDAVLDTGSGSESMPVPSGTRQPQNREDSPGNGAWSAGVGCFWLLSSILFSLLLS
jgi:hypothetical protein